MTLPALVALTACEVKDSDSGHADHDHDHDHDVDHDVDADDTGSADDTGEAPRSTALLKAPGKPATGPSTTAATSKPALRPPPSPSSSSRVLTATTATSSRAQTVQWTCSQADGTNDVTCTSQANFDFSEGGVLPTGAEVLPRRHHHTRLYR